MGARGVPVGIPVGRAGELEGGIALRAGIARRGDATPDPPAEMAGAIAAAREMLVESVAETDDALLEKYLDGGTITDQELTKALHNGFAAGSVFPVLAVCATRGGAAAVACGAAPAYSSIPSSTRATATSPARTSPTSCSSRATRTPATPTRKTVLFLLGPRLRRLRRIVLPGAIGMVMVTVIWRLEIPGNKIGYMKILAVT